MRRQTKTNRPRTSQLAPRGRLGISVAAGLLAATVWPVDTAAQRSGAARARDATVDIVQTVGCVESRPGEPGDWWLTQASVPSVTGPGVFNAEQVDEARSLEPGSDAFHLIGVAEFLDPESQLEWGERARFTTPEQANAPNELRDGRRVLVKGLLIEAETGSRINLLSVVGLSETCE